MEDVDVGGGCSPVRARHQATSEQRENPALFRPGQSAMHFLGRRSPVLWRPSFPLGASELRPLLSYLWTLSNRNTWPCRRADSRSSSKEGPRLSRSSRR